MAKILSDKEKSLIIADYKTGQYSQRELAKKHNVSIGTVNKLTKDIDTTNEKYLIVSNKDAADKAAGVAGSTSAAQIAESSRQFDAIQNLLSPYAEAGPGALQAQQNLLGLGGEEAQKAAYAGIEGSPAFQSMAQQGENAMLQNASATGGLRGGNIQGALAQYRPQLLSQLIQQQYQNLGGLTSIGQNAAAGVGNAGMQTPHL